MRGRKFTYNCAPYRDFWRRYRGNVFNLLNQIASGQFLMVGTGENKKSMAYIGNVVAFLENCIATDQEYGLYNYVDTPDLTMNELVMQVRAKLKGKDGVGLRLPYWLGIILGYTADLVAKISGKNLPVSSCEEIRVIDQFKSAKRVWIIFKRHFVSHGVERTLKSEFISPDANEDFLYRMTSPRKTIGGFVRIAIVQCYLSSSSD